jgi:dinuclear metal center YbgI/SA1388 family protein
VETAKLVRYLDEYLRTAECPDDARALNGLQVEGGSEVTRVGVAVDAAERTIREAAARACDFLIVHHGLFWDGNQPLTGRRYRKVGALFRAGMALYSSHVPLDVHPVVGNNAVLATRLGVAVRGSFGGYKGVEIGVWGDLEIGREALAARLDDLLGCRIRFVPGGGERIARVGVVTGSGGDLIGEAVALGLDAFVTGEGPHHTYFDGLEGGINVYFGGHYATETWGVRALGAHLGEELGLAWEFIDMPTGT